MSWILGRPAFTLQDLAASHPRADEAALAGAPEGGP
jgi:hypothetical protein